MTRVSAVLSVVLLYLGCDGEEVDRISETLGSLHGCDIRIHQHGLNALLLQSLDALRAAVIKLTGLNTIISSCSTQE